MILKNIAMKNFRQFYGEQELALAAGEGGDNVTVIHGYNGAGKTALLNAFIWCLYGETTPDLEDPENLENERAIAEARVAESVNMSVRVAFSHQDTEYIVERSRTSKKEEEGQLARGGVDVRIWSDSKGGDLSPISINLKEVQPYIHQLLPLSLYPFFFFNGERVEWLASPEAYDNVESGIKTLLNVTIFERGVDHLRRTILPHIRKELKQYGEKELLEALDRQERLDEDHRRLSDEIGRKHEEIKELEVEIEKYEKKQDAITSLVELTARRKALRGQLESCEEDNKKIETNLRRILSRDGYLSFASSVFETTERLVKEARQRGEIPAKIKPQFVNDLLEKGMCICERALSEGTAARDALVRWRADTGVAELEEAISQTAAMLEPLRQRRDEFSRSLDRHQAERSEALARKQQEKKELAIVEQEIGDQEGEDASYLTERLKELRRDLTKRQTDRGIAEVEKTKKEEEQRSVREEVAKLQAQGEKAKLLKRQLEAVERVADALEEVFELRKAVARVRLDEQIRQMWRDVAIKDYRAEVSNDYRLVLTKQVGPVSQRVQGASTGEKQVLALSFVASLVRELEKNSQDPDARKAFGLTFGGVFPLVMDSPFGSLEDYYRKKVAEWVPKLARQVVVLVSSTQWKDEVDQALSGKIGRSYILELHTTRENAARKLRLGGREFPYVVVSEDPYEFTSIKEVR